ncbi:60S ribosomal protein L27 [Trichuris trichiura]|uniref:60S ribosomal protein L27 n=1 Tax=Trichuris trichiura TaxID=36087 RepID=A0A077ZLC9_TRITR|nr:60S ribosomal protein L27 [Trichuris trichiura]
MGKIMKAGMVVLVLAGKYAGRKGLIVRTFDESTNERAYAHALVAGIDRYPLKITRKMGKHKRIHRSTIRPFLKIYNYSHLLPTRYKVADFTYDKKIINKECFRDPARKIKANREVKQMFQKRFKAGKNKWFFTKLRF